MSPRALLQARGSRRECYLTAAAGRSTSARRLFGEVAEFLARRGLVPMRETIYGTLRARRATAAARAAAFSAQGLDPAWPAAYLEGRPAAGAGLAGVQVWARRSRVRTVGHDWARGRLWSSGGRRFLQLCAIPGRGPEGRPRERAAQARLMLDNAGLALRAHGFEFRHVARTWIYLHRILDWYDDFNLVRNDLYRRPEFLGAGFRTAAPASTGIGAAAPAGDCVMDLLAVRREDSGGPAAELIRRTARQGPAPAYGSAFSRGAALRDGAGTAIHVSGTASIDPSGRSVAAGDPQAQSLHTLLSVAEVLGSRGAGLEDICSSTLFCKDRRSYEAFLKVRRLLRLPDWPMIAVLADVCRPELCVELEAVAVKGSAGSGMAAQAVVPPL